jgi:hypothetical protein
VSLYELIIKKDDDWEIMNEFGLLNCIHFVDMNSEEQSHKLQYTSELRRAENIEAKLKSIEDLCFSHNVRMKQPDSVDDFLGKMDKIRQQKDKAPRLLFNEIEEDIIKKEQFITSQKQIFHNLVDTYNQQLAQINVLKAYSKLMA